MNFVAIYFAKDPVAERKWQEEKEIIRLRRERREYRWQMMLEELDYEVDPYYQEEPPKPRKPFVWPSKQAYEWHLQCKEMDEYQRQYDACATY
jgi:hypothetical protein